MFGPLKRRASRWLLAGLALAILARPAEARRRSAHVPDPPAIQHVFLVVMENQDAQVAFTRQFTGRLALQGGVLANYHCITHPSQPNYIALVAGSTLGVTDNVLANLSASHLGDLLDARGLPWKLYAESYPGDCYLGATADHDLYVRRHVPFLQFLNVTRNAERCRAHVVNATELDADLATGSLPAFSMYIPDNIHNGHDSNADVADAWLEGKFTFLLRDPRFIRNTLFILTWDESGPGDTTQTALIFLGAGVIPGSTTTTRYDHYDLLRTIEEILHLGTLHREDERTGERIRDVLVVP